MFVALVVKERSGPFEALSKYKWTCIYKSMLVFLMQANLCLFLILYACTAIHEVQYE
ncbi:hypothetical protein EMIT0P201_12256 [Pseudomonas chlororaphis]